MRVLVLVANGLPCGYLGPYGCDWVDTPTFDRLAAEGIVFDQHFADAPNASGGRRAWRTGRYHLPNPGTPVAASAAEPNLFTILQAGGVRFSQIFQKGPRSCEILGEASSEHVDLEDTIEAARAALDGVAATSSAVIWVELSTLLPPWRFPGELFTAAVPSDEREEADDGEDDEEEEDEEDEESEVPEPALVPLLDPPTGPLGDDPDEVTIQRLQETFAAAVRYLDAGLEQLLEGIGDDWLIIVTSDRGAVLGEHGIIGPHRPWLHEELVHLTLIVRMPAAAHAGRRIQALTQPIDLLPTLLELFGVAPPAGIHGHSLAPMLRGGDMPMRDYACVGLQIGLAVEWALRTPHWSYLLPLQGEIEDAARPAQLYAKPEDRWEVNDVRQHHLELSEHFDQVLRDFVAASQQPGTLAPPKLRDIEAELAVQ
jgi:arylsulfatase A-like enzyme